MTTAQTIFKGASCPVVLVNLVCHTMATAASLFDFVPALAPYTLSRRACPRVGRPPGKRVIRSLM